MFSYQHRQPHDLRMSHIFSFAVRPGITFKNAYQPFRGEHSPSTNALMERNQSGHFVMFYIKYKQYVNRKLAIQELRQRTVYKLVKKWLSFEPQKIIQTVHTGLGYFQ